MPEALWLLVAAALVAAGTVWRARHRSKRFREVGRALLDPDPAVRAPALQVLASSGLRRWAPMIAERVRSLDPHTLTDDDAAVAAELAWLVTVCQWEPADEPSMLQLRLWAKLYHQVRGTPASHAEVAQSDDATSAPTADAIASDARSSLVAAAEDALGERVVEVRFWPNRPRSVNDAD